MAVYNIQTRKQHTNIKIYKIFFKTEQKTLGPKKSKPKIKR